MNEEKVRTRHLNYFSQLAEQAEPAMRGPDQKVWRMRLNDERDNLRVALEWAAKSDAKAGLRLAGSLLGFWESVNLSEGVRWLDEFLEKPESKDYSQARAKALYTKAMLLWWVQEVHACHLAAQESLDLYRACGNNSGEIDALSMLAMSDDNNWNNEILGLCQQALDLAVSLRDERRQAQVFEIFSWRDDDYSRRASHLQKAAALFIKAGDMEAAAEQMISLAEYELESGNPQSAQRWLNEAIRESRNSNHAETKTDVRYPDIITALSRQLRNRGRLAYSLISFARIAFMLGDLENAYASLYKSIEISEELGHRLFYYYARSHLAYLFLWEGETTAARQIFLDSATNFQQDQNPIGVAFSLEGIASLLVMRGKPLHAAYLIGWSDGAREKVKDTRPPLEQVDVDKTITACIEKMGEAAFSDAYDEGKKMSMEVVIAFALEDP